MCPACLSLVSEVDGGWDDGGGAEAEDTGCGDDGWICCGVVAKGREGEGGGTEDAVCDHDSSRPGGVDGGDGGGDGGVDRFDMFFSTLWRNSFQAARW